MLFTYDIDKDIIRNDQSIADFFPFNRTQTNQYVDLCIEITRQCNRKCANCFSMSGPNTYSPNLPYEWVENYLNQHAKDFIRLTLTGGEPLLHPQITNFLNLPIKFPNIGYVINTNATLLKRHLSTILENRWTVAISIHGSPKTHSSYSLEPNFDNIIENLNLCAKHTTTHIYSVLHEKISIEDIDWLYKKRNDSGAKFLRFITPRKFGRYGPAASTAVVNYVKKRLDNTSSIKTNKSRTKLITINGEIKETN